MTQTNLNGHRTSPTSSCISHIGAASFLAPARVDQPELLDEGEGTLADVRMNLDEIWNINQAFASLRSVTNHLKENLSQINRPVRIVDLGTGAGKMALFLMAWAQRHHFQMEIYPLDFSGRNLSVAQENIKAAHGIRLIQANGLELPFAPNSIDYYISSLFLHHFAPDDLIHLLRETYRLSRRGIIMNDIVRGYLPLAAFYLTQPIFARHFLTRHDGLISAKRAYTVAELLEMAHAAGLEHARVETRFPWRMTLVAVKSDV